MITYCSSCGLGTSFSGRKPLKCSSCGESFGAYIQPVSNNNNDMTNMLVKKNPPNDYVMTNSENRNPNQVYDYPENDIDADNPITEKKIPIRNPNETLASLNVQPLTEEELEEMKGDKEILNMGAVISSAAASAKMDLSKVKAKGRGQRK